MPGLQTRQGIDEEEAEAQLAEDLAREVMADYLCGDPWTFLFSQFASLFLRNSQLGALARLPR